MFETIKRWLRPDPQVGEIWGMYLSEDPFLKVALEDTVKVLDIRNGWVKFAYLNSATHFSTMITRFKKDYRLYEAAS
jgi:hypothetical protein